MMIYTLKRNVHDLTCIEMHSNDGKEDLLACCMHESMLAPEIVKALDDAYSTGDREVTVDIAVK